MSWIEIKGNVGIPVAPSANILIEDGMKREQVDGGWLGIGMWSAII